MLRNEEPVFLLWYGTTENFRLRRSLLGKGKVIPQGSALSLIVMIPGLYKGLPGLNI